MFLDKENYATAAKRAGIDQCIRRNERNAKNSPKVLRKSINAIIAAVLVDSFDLKSTLMATLRYCKMQPVCEEA